MAALEGRARVIIEGVKPEIDSGRYLWHGAGNYVELNQNVCPAHIFRVHRRLRREQDLDYYYI